MEIVFETTIASTNGEPTFYSHEPSNAFIRYYLSAYRLGNKSAVPELGIFDDLVFEDEQPRMSVRPTTNFGIKSFPRFGSYGFYTPRFHTSSIMLVPINRSRTLADLPEVTVTDNTTTIHLALAGYECYRIIIRKDQFTTEYVTYESEFEFAPPYTAPYSITVVGHKDEISVTSHPFEHYIT